MRWHYTTIHFEAMNELGLSAIEYIISDLTYHQSKSGAEWWPYSPSQIGELLGLSEKTIRDVFDRCVEKGTINKDGREVISCQKFIDVVYPRSGRNFRLDGRNFRPEVEETSAYHNYIYKENTTAGAATTDVPMESFLRGDLGDSKSPRISGDKKKAYDELIAWSENERGFPFPKTTRPKQYRAFKLANENGISRDALIERWEEMSSDKFWQKAGFDWMNVVQDVLKKPV